MHLEDILRRHVPHLDTFGGPLPGDLSADLALLSKRLWFLTCVTVAMIVAIFVVEIAVAILYLHEPAVLAGVGGAVGLTIAGAIDRMTRVARELGQTTLLISLSGRLVPEQMEKVVSVLVEQLDSGRGVGGGRRRP